jgi:hypothetical protein
METLNLIIFNIALPFPDGLGGPGSIPRKNKQLFRNAQSLDHDLGITVSCPMAIGIKLQGHNVDHSHPSSTEVELYLHSQLHLHGEVLN